MKKLINLFENIISSNLNVICGNDSHPWFGLTSHQILNKEIKILVQHYSGGNDVDKVILVRDLYKELHALYVYGRDSKYLVHQFLMSKISSIYRNLIVGDIENADLSRPLEEYYFYEEFELDNNPRGYHSKVEVFCVSIASNLANH